MRIRTQDVLETTKSMTYDEPTELLNPLLAQGVVHDYEFVEPATVRLDYYRAGPDLLFDGHAVGHVVGQCARCLEAYRFEVDVPFLFIFVPRPHVTVGAETGDADLTYYDGPEVDLSTPLRERLILALPTQPLCREGCQGLCPECGVNRNVVPCGCGPQVGDLRLAALRHLRVGS
jgi:uncharacterized protein